MKPIKIIFIIISFALIFLGIIYTSSDFLTPYVNIQEAIAKGKRVQVRGKIDKNTIILNNENTITFSIKDDTNSMITVHYKKKFPANFHHADDIVVIGKYSKKDNIFHADEILYKCPSKYQTGENKN